MLQLDLPALMNLIISGIIGVILGLISGWATYRYQLKRDKIAWQREQENLEKQAIREEIVKGIDNPKETIKQLLFLTKGLQTQLNHEDHKIQYLDGPGPEKVPLRYAQLHVQQMEQLLAMVDKELDEYSKELDNLRDKLNRAKHPPAGHSRANPNS